MCASGHTPPAQPMLPTLPMLLPSWRQSVQHAGDVPRQALSMMPWTALAYFLLRFQSLAAPAVTCVRFCTVPSACSWRWVMRPSWASNSSFMSCTHQTTGPSVHAANIIPQGHQVMSCRCHRTGPSGHVLQIPDDRGIRSCPADVIQQGRQVMSCNHHTAGPSGYVLKTTNNRAIRSSPCKDYTTGPSGQTVPARRSHRSLTGSRTSLSPGKELAPLLS